MRNAFPDSFCGLREKNASNQILVHLLPLVTRKSHETSTGEEDPDGMNSRKVTLIGWLTRWAAAGVISYQMWSSTQSDSLIRQIAEATWFVMSGSHAAAPAQAIPWDKIAPIIYCYWGLLCFGGLCLWLPDRVGHLLLIREHGALLTSTYGSEWLAWMIGWGIVFMLPGLITACAQWQP